MSHFEQCDQWGFSVLPKKGGGWTLTLIDCGQAVDQVQTFPAGDQGHDDAIDAGQEWLWADERGMGRLSPMLASGGSSQAAGRNKYRMRAFCSLSLLQAA